MLTTASSVLSSSVNGGTTLQLSTLKGPAWEGVKSIILEIFAGPADRGEYSPSVQNTLYLTAQKVLEKMPEVEKVYINLPNVHYFGVDYSRFPKIDFVRNDDNVYMPTDKPSGNINATIARKPKSRL